MNLFVEAILVTGHLVTALNRHELAFGDHIQIDGKLNLEIQTNKKIEKKLISFSYILDQLSTKEIFL